MIPLEVAFVARAEMVVWTSWGGAKKGHRYHTPDNGVPTLYIINEDSPFFGRVWICDRPISVDGTGTTMMLASHIAGLRTVKGRKRYRNMFFVRDYH